MPEITVKVRGAPLLGAAVDLLQATEEFAELIPDWHSNERDEFLEKCRAFHRLLILNLEVEKG